MSGWQTADGKPASRKRAAKKKTRTAKKKLGRPPKSTPERLQAMIKAAKRPLTMEGIARAGGISKQTLYEYKEKFPDFSDELTRTRAETEQRLAKLVEDEDPKFLLERSFGYFKRVELTGEDGGPLKLFQVKDDWPEGEGGGESKSRRGK